MSDRLLEYASPELRSKIEALDYKIMLARRQGLERLATALEVEKQHYLRQI